MKAILFTKTGNSQIASAIGPPYTLEFSDDVVAVLYKACDNSDTPVGAWLWEGKTWDVVGIDEFEKIAKRLAPKPKPVKKVKPVKETPEVVVDESKLSQVEWTAAQRAKVEERQQAVLKAAKKVLK